MSAGLVGYWSFDEGTGTIAQDASGRGNNGTITSSAWTAGKIGQALLFNGYSSKVVIVDNNLSFSFGTGDFTLSAWINTTDPTTIGTGRDDILAKGNPTVTGFSLSVDRNRASSYVGSREGQAGYSSTAPVINDGLWHHIASRRTAGNVEVLSDGVVVFTYTASGTVDVTSSLIIGRHGTKPESFFDGTIDEVRLFNRALSNAEIAAEMAR